MRSNLLGQIGFVSFSVIPNFLQISELVCCTWPEFYRKQVSIPVVLRITPYHENLFRDCHRFCDQIWSEFSRFPRLILLERNFLPSFLQDFAIPNWKNVLTPRPLGWAAIVCESRVHDLHHTRIVLKRELQMNMKRAQLASWIFK